MSGITTPKKENAKYRVCIITAILPPEYGGAEVAAFQYAERLRKDPESCAIIIGWDRNGAYKKHGYNYDFVHDVSFPENPHDAKGVFIYFQQYGHMFRCFRALLPPMWKYRDRYDVIHNFNSGFAFNRTAILIAKLLGKKAVTETSLVGDDDPISLGKLSGWKDHLKPKYVRYLFYKLADAYVSKSAYITDIFKKSEIPMRKVFEIPYSVDTKLFKTSGVSEKSAMRKKLGLWDEGRIMLFVGGVNERKNVHMLAGAFAELAPEFPDLKLIIAGPTYKYDANYVNSIQNLISEKSLNGRFLMTGKSVGNVSEFMMSSDIFVLPSNKEGFPISVIEAMSSGLAVVCSDIPEISGVQINNGVDGRLFKQGDQASLTHSLRELLSSNGKMSEFGNIAREKALSNWSTEIVDGKYKELYDRVLRRSSRKPGKGKSEKRKIRILFNIPNFNTAGSGRAMLNVIERLDRNEFEPEICCRHSKGELFRYAQMTGIPIHIDNFTTLMKPRIKAMRKVMMISRFFKEIDPDIIHSYNYSDDYSEALAARLAGIKWIYTKKNMSWGGNAWKLRTRLATAIIPQNKDMIERFFSERNNLHLIPIGIDINEFASPADTRQIAEKFSLEDASPLIITIANVIPIKGIEHLVQGFSLIMDDLPKARLLIIGEDNTEYASKLKAEIEEKRLTDRIIFAGKQSNIKPFFKIADIFILSSTKTGEGGPISMLEAMASGVLCYGSDVPGIRDQFKEFPDQLFESENPGSIANKIIHSVRMTEEERQSRLKKQLEFIWSNYSIEGEVRRLQELYRNIVNEKSSISK